MSVFPLNQNEPNVQDYTLELLSLLSLFTYWICNVYFQCNIASLNICVRHLWNEKRLLKIVLEHRIIRITLDVLFCFAFHQYVYSLATIEHITSSD